jgi:hypothetical protein
LALANSMRLSLMKAAHADVGGAPWREIRVAHRFRPTYAMANVGHPSSSFWPGYDTGLPRSVEALDHRQLAAEKASEFNGIGVLPGIATGVAPGLGAN